MIPGTEIQSMLCLFHPIGLNDMDDVKLMNRIEIKYLFSVNRLNKLLEQLSQCYEILEIGTVRLFPYHTTYFDTTDRLFYNMQTRGKLNRYKVRYRCYENSGTSFLEIKKKTNKRRTIKWRIEKGPEIIIDDNEATEFLLKHLPFSFTDLQAVLANRFNRITLVGREFNERITLDTNIRFSDKKGIVSEMPFLAVAELKIDRFNCKSEFSYTMKKAGIHPIRFSKFCTGSALSDSHLKGNILKPNLLLINKIENEYTKSL